MEDMRIAKFETLVEDINRTIERPSPFNKLLAAMYNNGAVAKKETTPLHMIFEPESLNDFAKIICDKAWINLCVDPWKEKYGTKSLVDSKIKIDAAKDFVKYCRESDMCAAYEFIFWSLFILTVQKDGYDDKLSLICDFAHMLRISDDELMDISYTIKCIYNEVETEYEFKSGPVLSLLGDLWCLYGNMESKAASPRNVFGLFRR